MEREPEKKSGTGTDKKTFLCASEKQFDDQV